MLLLWPRFRAKNPSLILSCNWLINQEPVFYCCSHVGSAGQQMDLMVQKINGDHMQHPVPRCLWALSGGSSKSSRTMRSIAIGCVKDELDTTHVWFALPARTHRPGQAISGDLACTAPLAPAGCGRYSFHDSGVFLHKQSRIDSWPSEYCLSSFPRLWQ